MESQYISKHHGHVIGANQCSYALTKHIKDPIDIVWSLERRFDQPQKYKSFVCECTMNGELKTGSLREVNVTSGLPASTSSSSGLSSNDWYFTNLCCKYPIRTRIFCTFILSSVHMFCHQI